MKTIVISVEELTNKRKGYPVRLHLDDGSPGWLQQQRALAFSYIPATLRVLSPPRDPLTDQSLQGQRLREIFLEEEESSERFDAIGQYLYKLLFSGEVGTKWDELCRKYPEEGEQSEGRRTILDISPAALRRLPWELMSARRLPLSLDLLNPVVRGRLEAASPQIYYQWPLHVLVVVGSEHDDNAVEAAQEVSDIEDALIKFGRPVDWELLTRPSNQELVDMMKYFKPHVFHFIGHGRRGSGGNAPVLVFEEGANSEPWEWSARKIILDLRQSWTPRFAFINACRSSDEQESEKVWGITEAFIEAGVTAVLGMQADVQGSSAARFPGRLYEAMARDRPLDLALVEARNDVRRLTDDGLERRDWALATFFLSALPEQVLPMSPPATDTLKTDIDDQFSDISDFVDRKQSRRTIWQGVESAPGSDGARRLLIVRGTAEAGKTWLVYWCLKSCAWRERNVRYVSLEQNKTTKDLVQVMRRIKKGDPDHPIGRAFNPEAFREFNETVNYILDPESKEPPPGRAGAMVEDKEFPFREDIDDDSIMVIMGAFKLGLQKAANEQPLVIALDDLLIREDHYKDYLLPELIRPIAKGGGETLKNIRMILVVDDSRNEYEEFKLASLEGVSVTIQLGDLLQNELELFARELCILKGLTREKAKHFSELICRGKAPTMKPGDLRQMVKLWLTTRP